MAKKRAPKKPSAEEVLAKKLMGLAFCEDCGGSGKYFKYKKLSENMKFLKNNPCLRCKGAGWYNIEDWHNFAKKAALKKMYGGK